jgi:hypothetical protein
VVFGCIEPIKPVLSDNAFFIDVDLVSYREVVHERLVRRVVGQRHRKKFPRAIESKETLAQSVNIFRKVNETRGERCGRSRRGRRGG